MQCPSGSDTSVTIPQTNGLSSTINGETSTGIYSAGPTPGQPRLDVRRGKYSKIRGNCIEISSDEYARVEDEAYASHDGSSWLYDGDPLQPLGENTWTTDSTEYGGNLEHLCIPESCEPCLSLIPIKRQNPWWERPVIHQSR